MEQLSELDVLLVDCQTTGATPEYGVVLEIGWGLAKACRPNVERAQAHWVMLPEGHGVTHQVRRLTGFDETEVRSALEPREAWARLRATMTAPARMPTAIHFAKFELAFLRDWAQRFDPGVTFPLDAVCLHAIACRLYPDLPRRSLRALAGYLGHGVDLTRRCRGHVEATAFIWQKLAAELGARGIRTWDQVRDWLETTPVRPRPRRRRYPMPSSTYRALPDGPGVYHLLRSNGDVLYVGKALCLRKRVASHFTAGSSTTERALEMLTQVGDIRVTLTPTPLEAALLENESIKSLRPPYNVELLGADPRTWFATVTLDDASPEADETYRCGPLPSTFSVLALGAIRALLSGEAPSPSLIARAVGSPDWSAPDEAVFRSGFAAFSERHALGRPAADPRRSLALVARKLILEARLDPSSKGEAELEDEANDDAAVGANGPRAWDTERVVRHLEREVAHGHQLLARARWLCLLYDSVVLFQEPPISRPRVLRVRDGRIVEAREWISGETQQDPVAYRPLEGRRAAFDRSLYDRLRTLTSELKRILRDRGAAAVRVGRAHWLRDATLESLLFWV